MKKNIVVDFVPDATKTRSEKNGSFVSLFMIMAGPNYLASPLLFLLFLISPRPEAREKAQGTRLVLSLHLLFVAFKRL